MEQNRTSKYFKYAIGEIILVVIGILIALQINNWNENRKLQHEINTYLNQKLVNLKEDRIRLTELKKIRTEKSKKSAYVFDKGIKNIDVIEFTNIVYLIVIERHFITTIERSEASITKYYSGTKESTINKLEQRYVNKINEMTLEENRLNTFSENAEYDLWLKGFLIDNRQLFSSINENMDISKFKGDVPKLILNENNGQKALEGIFRRNELANPSLILKLDELIKINKKLMNEIENYLN